MKNFKFGRGTESEVDDMTHPVTAITETFMLSGSTVHSFDNYPRITSGNTLNDNIIIKKSRLERVLSYIFEPYLVLANEIKKIFITLKDEIKAVFDPLSK